jgi:hypothetical protein
MRRAIVRFAAGVGGTLILGAEPGAARSASASCEAGKTWSVTPAGDILEVGYGCGTDFPQHAALHLASCYARFVPTADSAFATSVILCPSYWGVVAGAEAYHQGTAIDATWKVKGRRLILRFEGVIGDLGFAGKLVLSPPARSAMKARVSVSTFGTPALADRPGEAFKPVMLSSMRISPTVWDASHVLLGTTPFSLPESGFVFPGGAPSSADFGLLGGSSAWKVRAPTVTVHAAEALAVQGWVTESDDPNDDNVGLWLASDTVLASWRYRVRVTRAE